MWWWLACASESPAPPAVEPPPAPVRVDRRTAGPCDAEEMLGALVAAGAAVGGASAGDELCQGRFGRIVLTDEAGGRTIALLSFEAGEWRALEVGPESCDGLRAIPADVCAEMLYVRR